MKGLSMPAKSANNAVPALADTVDLSTLNYQELMSLVQGGEGTHIQELDNRVALDKSDLVNVPLFITGIAFGKEDKYDNGGFVVLDIATQSGKVGWITDGSTGIRDQIQRFITLTGEALRLPVWLPKGLTRSDYSYTDDDGKVKPATTFYLNNQE